MDVHLRDWAGSPEGVVGSSRGVLGTLWVGGHVHSLPGKVLL